uniref:CSON014907 protein n=1 Tax=Culicoides sonorensis TaxID=179676 RepID=A0A336MCA9_CULSO
MKFPSTIDINVYKAYINTSSIRQEQNGINAIDLHWETTESLKDLCIRILAENWNNQPIFSVVDAFPEDQRQLLDSLDVSTLKLNDLVTHIQADDGFWKRCFIARWPNFVLTNTNGKKWIRIFLEKHLSESLENMKPANYTTEQMQQLIDLCVPHVEELKINHLQPGTTDSHGDHIPLDYILSNLSELKIVNLTYDVKSVGKNFVLGCSNISDNDIKLLTHGLARCYELQEFHLHSSKLDSHMLQLLANSLEKHSYLRTINLLHCRCGDTGLSAFLEAISHDSFPALKNLILTNNFLSSEGALQLAKACRRRNIEKLDIRLNPITSEGAAAIFSVLNEIPIIELNMACCSLDETIGPYIFKAIKENKTLKSLNVSANHLGQKIGEELLRIIPQNKVIQELDIRNSDISYAIKSAIDSSILENRDREIFEWT